MWSNLRNTLSHSLFFSKGSVIARKVEQSHLLSNNYSQYFDTQKVALLYPSENKQSKEIEGEFCGKFSGIKCNMIFLPIAGFKDDDVSCANICANFIESKLIKTVL